MKTEAQILWECLQLEGAKHVFGHPGGRHFAGLRCAEERGAIRKVWVLREDAPFVLCPRKGI